MSKRLSEMTLNELWELFPILLIKPQTEWKDWYEEEKEQLNLMLPPTVKIHHIGSTAIEGICAKPIIDILVETNFSEFEQIKVLLLKNDYICMAQGQTSMDFNKGYTPKGFAQRVFHLHLKNYGDNDEIYFRNYLNEHPKIAKEYEHLKLSIWKNFEHDRGGYTNSKTTFVKEYTHKAILLYGRIY